MYSEIEKEEVPWDELDDTSPNIKIKDALKDLDNVINRGMSANILKDMLRVYDKIAMKEILKTREKTLAQDKRSVETLHLAVQYFDAKMDIRRSLLETSIVKSKSKTFSKIEYWWKEKYRERRMVIYLNESHTIPCLVKGICWHVHNHYLMLPVDS